MVAVGHCRFLTDSGIEFLREYLNLPSEIVPATLKKSTRPLERDSGRYCPQQQECTSRGLGLGEKRGSWVGEEGGKGDFFLLLLGSQCIEL
jgi:small subunit ribosomal protein S10e